MIIGMYKERMDISLIARIAGIQEGSVQQILLNHGILMNH